MATSIATLLLDPDRLAVAGALAVRPMTTDELAAVTGRSDRDVLVCLGELRHAGLVRQDESPGDANGETRYVLDTEALRAAAKQQAEVELPMDPAIGFGMTDDERAVLERFFAGRTLIEFPAQCAKQLVVLQRLALEFDLGRRYTEIEVNEILFPFFADWSTLRRHLVDEGFLDRESIGGGNQYWRSGGRVTDLPPE
ncbi:MAG: ArsR family transcriptional regulator [Acidimicrobiaceae bacterium]|nr:ArsR family transcriptional regulator [Acidimicrobiaceae bacterium]